MAVQRQQFGMRAALDDAPLFHDQDLVAFSMVDRRWAMTRVVRLTVAVSRAAWMWRSDSVSSAEVASSRISSGASLRMARAMARRWRWPPESSTPFSPTSVS
jgi:hypothetical protein